MLFGVVLSALSLSAGMVVESARELPVAAEADVLVLGGTAAAVSAAKAAAKDGASVFLATGAAYLGEDLAGTLELACDDSSGATPLERRLRASTSDTVHYAYRQANAFKHRGGWQFANDSHEKFSTTLQPSNPWDSVFYLEPAEVTCTLDRPAEIAAVEVTVIENDDPALDAALVVDHRGCLRLGQKGPLTGRVTLTCLDGPKAGETLELTRLAKTTLVEGRGIREGEPSAVVAEVTGHPNLRQHASYFSVSCGFAFSKARVEVAAAEGSDCHLLSRIHFRLARTEDTACDPTPLKVKRTLDRELIHAGVRFITTSPVTDLLVDDANQVAGAVIANRNGRQAIIAKSVIDCTRLSSLASGGKPFAGREGTKAKFSLVSMLPPSAPGAAPIVERKLLELPIGDGSYRALSAAEQMAREQAWDSRAVDVAEFMRPQFAPAVIARRFLRAVPDVGTLGARIVAGESAGRDAAAEALSRKTLSGVHVLTSGSDTGRDLGKVREFLGGLRPYAKAPVETVPSAARSLPCAGDFDVIVVGGGTSGAAAGVAAARGGAKTLVLEYLHVLGGVGTDGMITGYYDGNHCGFTEEFKAAVKARPAANSAYKRIATWWQFCRDAGAEVWYGALATGAVVAEPCAESPLPKVVGVVVATPFGRAVVTARSVIDATGNSDVAAAAGAETQFISASELALQSAGQAPHRLLSGINSDFGLVNDTDTLDLWLFSLRSRAGAPDAWDLQQLVDSRERRRIVSDRMVMGWDVVRNRRYGDVIIRATSKQDSHGYLIDDYGAVAERDGLIRPMINLPLRTMLPRGLAGIAVVGLGKGVSRDVVPFTRMQADLMNEGYAVGLCAAQAARSARGDYRRIDIRKVQQELVEKGNLPSDVLTWQDAPEAPSDEELAAAVKTLPDGFAGAGVVMAARTRAVPLLRAAYREAKTPLARQVYAELLGLCGDATGAETLAGIFNGTIKREQLPEKRCYGKGLTEIGLALALGRTKSELAVAPIGRMVEALVADSTMGEVRAATLAAEAHGGAALAPSLAAAMKKPGMAGWARQSADELAPLGGYFISEETDRCLKELALARALWACGDCEGLAERTLRAYSADPRGVFAEHAHAVLERRH